MTAASDEPGPPSYGPSTYGDDFADVYDDWYSGVSDVQATAELVTQLAREAGNTGDVAVGAVAGTATGPVAGAAGDAVAGTAADVAPGLVVSPVAGAAASPVGRVLELGVGTGRLALAIAAKGVSIDGIDSSAAILERLAEKDPQQTVGRLLGDIGANNFGTGNSADLVVAPGPYQVVFVAYNTFFNLTSEQAQLCCLKSVAQRLAADGKLLIEVFLPAQRSATGNTSNTNTGNTNTDNTNTDNTSTAPQGPSVEGPAAVVEDAAVEGPAAVVEDAAVEGPAAVVEDAAVEEAAPVVEDAAVEEAAVASAAASAETGWPQVEVRRQGQSLLLNVSVLDAELQLVRGRHIEVQANNDGVPVDGASADGARADSEPDRWLANIVNIRSWQIRYLSPSQLDELAIQAGLELESRWADWHRNPFDATGTQHVSVYRLA